MSEAWFAYLRGVRVFLGSRSVRRTVYGAIRRRNWLQARIWMGWTKPEPSKGEQ